MAERVGEIEVYASLEDRDLIAGLRRAEAEFERTRAKIAGSRAEADISADIEPLKRKLREAEADLKKFEKAAAKAKVAGDDKAAKEALAAQQKLVSELRKEHGERAVALKAQKAANAEAERAAELTIAQRKLDAARASALEQQEKRRAAAAKRAETEAARAAAAQARRDEQARKAQERAEAARLKAIENVQKAERQAYAMDARLTEKRVNDANRVAMANERAAIRRQKAEERANYEATVGVAKQQQQVISLQREYAKLTDAAERAAKRRAFTVETRAKLELDQQDIVAKMQVIKAELKRLGEDPPIEIHVEMERRQSLGRLRRQAAGALDVVRGIFEKASNLSTLAVRIGPFTGTIKQFAIALGFVGPLLVDLLGGASALIGVIGTGLAGAATVGAAGITGLGLAFGGIKMSIRDAVDDFKLAKQATDAYEKAVAKHGKTSKEAKNAQEQMNSVLKSVGPLAREAAKGSSEFRAGWERATQPTQRSLGNITRGFFGALQEITPAWSKSTNNLSKILDKNLRGGFKFFKTPEFRSNFSAITDNFNAAVPSLLHALGSIGRAFLNFGREGSKFLEPLGNSIDKAAGKLLAFTQRGDFDETIKRWAKHTADLGRFFAALGRVVIHFFGAGADAGDKFVVSMTNALNRWDRFLTSERGRNQVAEGMERAVAGTKALWNALAPIIGAFAVWANNFSPFIAGILQGVGAVLQLLNAVTKLIGLGGPLAALGATLGAIWAVGKIGAFVSMLARIPAILRSIYATQGALSAVGAVFSGRLLAGMKGGGVPGAPGGPGAVPVVVPTAVPRSADNAARGLTRMQRAGTAAKGALAGLGAVATGVPSVLAGVATAALAGVAGLVLYSRRTRDWEESGRAASKASRELRQGLTALDPSATALAQSTLSLTGSQNTLKDVMRRSAAEQRELNKLQDQGKTGTAAYRDLNNQHKNTLLEVRQAQLDLSSAEKARTRQTENNLALQDRVLAKAREQLSKSRQSLSDLGQNKDGSFFGLGGTKTVDAFKKVSAAAKEAGVSVTEFLKRDKGFAAAKLVPGTNIEKLSQYAQKIEDVRAAQARLQTAQERVTLAGLNHQRSLKGLVPIAQSAAKALHTVQQRAGKDVAQRISLKFQDPGQAQRVAASAAKSLRNGVPKTVTSRIVADSRGAEQTVRRLQAARLTPKRLSIIETGGQRAIATLERIIGRKLTQKELSIVEKGGSGVLGKLREIGSKDLPSKTQELKVRGQEGVQSAIRGVISAVAGIRDKTTTIRANDQASGVARGVASALNSIPRSVTSTVRVVRVGAKASANIGSASGRGMGGLSAQGASEPNQRQIDRAAITAELSGARKTAGGKYNQPTLLVGEENRSEVVISTNPKYRKRNLDYLRMAASALGTTVEAAIAGRAGAAARRPPRRPPRRPGRGRGPAGRPPDTAGSGGFGEFGAGGNFDPNVTIKPQKVYKPTKKFKNKLASRRSWADYIEGLQTQQGHWEREVSIRESQIKEPENMVVRAPENDRHIRDETTGEVTTVEAFKANPKIETEYKPSLAKVIEAMRELMRIVVELVRAIPHALSANKQEQNAREQAKSDLTRLIRQDNRRIRGASTDRGREKNQRNLERHKALRDEHQAEIDILKEDEKTLGAARVDAGFDVREVGIAQQKRQTEYDTATGDAATAAGEQNAQAAAGAPGAGGSGGGGGGGTGPPLSIEQQTASALQQNAETLRAFGENFINGANNPRSQFAPGAVAAPGTGFGQQTVTNPALLSPGAGASQAVASSRSAATFMTQPGRGGGGFAPLDNGSWDQSGPVHNTVVNNTFMAPPPDPHTWSRGVEFELGATI